MSTRVATGRGLAHRLAIEKQLLNEEKWVVEALKNIKKQRNSLQIERLHLTSLKGKLMMKKRGEKAAANPPSEGEHSWHQPQAQAQQPASEYNLSAFNMDDVCNDQELNLTVPQHTFHNPTRALEEIEEFENPELNDYEIDMNMLMNGIE